MTKDKRERFTFRLPSELMMKLRDESRKSGTSVNAFILKILWEWAKKHKI